MKFIRSKRASAEYIGAAVFVLVVVLFCSLILNIFSIISVKQQLDTCVDQLTRQIQLAGKVDADTDRLFDIMCGKIKSANNVEYVVNTTFLDGRRIQLGVPFSVTVSATAYIGGFGEFLRYPILLTSTAAGISEAYWKDD